MLTAPDGAAPTRTVEAGAAGLVAAAFAAERTDEAREMTRAAELEAAPETRAPEEEATPLTREETRDEVAPATPLGRVATELLRAVIVVLAEAAEPRAMDEAGRAVEAPAALVARADEDARTDVARTVA